MGQPSVVMWAGPRRRGLDSLARWNRRPGLCGRNPYRR